MRHIALLALLFQLLHAPVRSSTMSDDRRQAILFLAAQGMCPITREDALPILWRLLFGALRWNPVGRWGFHVDKLEGGARAA